MHCGFMFIVALIGVSVADLPVSASRKKCEEAYPYGGSIKFDEPSESGHEEVEENEFPYMVAIGHEKDGVFSSFCGGVLIDPNYVLCPAYCVQPKHIDLDSISIYVGKIDLSNPEALTGRIKAKRTIVHPDWAKNKKYNQIALIELEKSVSERPICLAEEDRGDQSLTLLMYEPDSKKLWKTPTNIVSNDKCSEFFSKSAGFGNGITDRQLCAKETNENDYRLASSGPLIVQKLRGKSFVPYVIGMSSLGLFGGQAPSIYEKIPSYVSWIESTIWQKS